jgi:hypothetical protein
MDLLCFAGERKVSPKMLITELPGAMKLIEERQESLLHAIANRDYAMELLVEEYGRQCIEEARILAESGCQSKEELFEKYSEEELPF